jgi:hypothetical protein
MDFLAIAFSGQSFQCHRQALQLPKALTHTLSGHAMILQVQVHHYLPLSRLRVFSSSVQPMIHA